MLRIWLASGEELASIPVGQFDFARDVPGLPLPSDAEVERGREYRYIPIPSKGIYYMGII